MQALISGGRNCSGTIHAQLQALRSTLVCLFCLYSQGWTSIEWDQWLRNFIVNTTIYFTHYPFWLTLSSFEEIYSPVMVGIIKGLGGEEGGTESEWVSKGGREGDKEGMEGGGQSCCSGDLGTQNKGTSTKSQPSTSSYFILWWSS